MRGLIMVFFTVLNAWHLVIRLRIALMRSDAKFVTITAISPNNAYLGVTTPDFSRIRSKIATVFQSYMTKVTLATRIPHLPPLLPPL
jgi:hypothetical protein